MENSDLIERIVALETEKKAQDREMKELKGKVEILATSFTNIALTNQTILVKMDNLTEKFNPIVAYIEELKTQPKKELNKFAWLIVTLITNTIWGAILFYFNVKK